MTTYEWITTFLVPVTGVVSWLAGARMRKNGAINAMQTTIDMLVQQNADLYKKMLELRQENSDLRVSIDAGNIEIERLKTEIERLKK
ncbi:MAG: hypothetical protein K6A94_12010 [Bacteroidales bacterium]|nr:hypothetical protein [Bacteroidales bacterium]